MASFVKRLSKRISKIFKTVTPKLKLKSKPSLKLPEVKEIKYYLPPSAPLSPMLPGLEKLYDEKKGKALSNNYMTSFKNYAKRRTTRKKTRKIPSIKKKTSYIDQDRMFNMLNM